MKLESQFQMKLTNALQRLGYWSYKIPDNIHTPKPYDMVCVSPAGITYHCELKVIDCDTFNKEDLRPNQRKSLGDITKHNPDVALVLIFSKKHQDYIIKRYCDVQLREKIFAKPEKIV